MKILYPVSLLVAMLLPVWDYSLIAKSHPGTVSFFRASGYYKKFKLLINNDFSYSETNTTKRNGALGFLITKYTSSKKYLNIALTINDRDTSFKYIVHDKDSLMISLGWNNAFVILNQTKYVWGYD